MKTIPFQVSIFLRSVLFFLGIFLSAEYSFSQATNDYRSLTSGNWAINTSWEKYNGTTWAACTAGDYPNNTARSVTVLNGHTIVINASAKSVKDFTINSGGKVWANAAVASGGGNIKYVAVYGNIVCNGTFGATGVNADAASLDLEGVADTISGSGLFAPCRMRKTLSTNNTTTVRLNIDTYLTYTEASAACLYNNLNGAYFNLIQGSGYNLTCEGSIGVDGVDGNSSNDRGGTFTFNGNVTINRTLFLTSNNPVAYPSGVTVGATGVVAAKTVYAGASGGLGTFTFTNNGIFKITGNNTDTINYPAGSNLLSATVGGGFYNYSSANNSYSFGAGSTIQYAGSGTQRIEKALNYKNLILSGSGNKTLVNNAIVSIANDFTITGSAVFAPGASNYTVNLQGNWTNYGTAGFTEGSSGSSVTVNFTGGSAQTITCPGGENFYDIGINNSSASGVTLACTMTVADVLTLTSGPLMLNANTLSITNSSISAIGVSAGWISSESALNASKISWTIGSVTGAYVFPFGKTSSDYIPFTFNLTSGNAGIVTVSTYGTSAANLPWPTSPTAITNFNTPQGVDDSNAAVDRFWQIDATGTPTADITFSYASSELPSFPYNFPASLRAQRYDGSANRWEAYIAGQTTSGFSVTVPGASAFTTWAITNNASPLPIHLVSFEAVCGDRKTEIKWTTASETDNDFFTVEKSTDGKTFDPIGRINGTGNTDSEKNYQFFDDKTRDGIAYYRLRQTDFNGHSETSSVAVTNCVNEDKVLPVYPNPAVDQIFCGFSQEEAGQVNIEVYDITGRKCISESRFANEGVSVNPVDISGLIIGLYEVKISSASGKPTVQKFAKTY